MVPESVCILCQTGAEKTDPGLSSSERRPGSADAQMDSHSPQLQGRKGWSEEVQWGSGPDAHP